MSRLKTLWILLNSNLFQIQTKPEVNKKFDEVLWHQMQYNQLGSLSFDQIQDHSVTTNGHLNSSITLTLLALNCISDGFRPKNKHLASAKVTVNISATTSIRKWKCVLHLQRVSIEIYSVMRRNVSSIQSITVFLHERRSETTVTVRIESQSISLLYNKLTRRWIVRIISVRAIIRQLLRDCYDQSWQEKLFNLHTSIQVCRPNRINWYSSRYFI